MVCDKVDNTHALNSAMRVDNFVSMSDIIYEITEELQLRRIIPPYIASAENPADAPSRQLPVNADVPKAVVGAPSLHKLASPPWPWHATKGPQQQNASAFHEGSAILSTHAVDSWLFVLPSLRVAHSFCFCCKKNKREAQLPLTHIAPEVVACMQLQCSVVVLRKVRLFLLLYFLYFWRSLLLSYTPLF